MYKNHLFAFSMKGNTLKLVSTHDELVKIKKLQEANLAKNLTLAEAKQEGTLAEEFSMEQLEAMHAAIPASIVLDGNGSVVGYALAVTKEVCAGISHLRKLVAAADAATYSGSPLGAASSPFVVIAQLCVAKAYRGVGLAPLLYGRLEEALVGTAVRRAVTLVPSSAPRSLKAHLNWGFQSLGAAGLGGELLLWDADAGCKHQ
jgi:GNAT superfamily N-acetyltransferase